MSMYATSMRMSPPRDRPPVPLRQRSSTDIDVDRMGLISGLVSDADAKRSRRRSSRRLTPRSTATTPRKQASTTSTSSPSQTLPVVVMGSIDSAGHEQPIDDGRQDSGRVRDRYGFVIPDDVKQEYAVWHRQASLETRERHQRFAHILNNVEEEHRDGEMAALFKAGIPPQHRRKMWLSMTTVRLEMEQRPTYYQSLLHDGEHDSRARSSRDQVSMDVGRTFQENKVFGTAEQERRLSNILNAYSVHNPVNGYAQGLNFIVSTFLILDFSEEESFWMLCHLMRWFPNNYDRHLTGCKADTEVFQYYFKRAIPSLYKFLMRHDVDTMLFFVPWMMQLFVSVLQYENAFRIWDRMMYRGPVELFECSLKLLNYLKPSIMALEGLSSTEVLIEMNRLVKHLVDIDRALAVMPGKAKCIDPGALQQRRSRKRDALRGTAVKNEQRHSIVDSLCKPATSRRVRSATASLLRRISTRNATTAALAGGVRSSSGTTESDDGEGCEALLGQSPTTGSGSTTLVDSFGEQREYSGHHETLVMSLETQQ